jgi:hypothetical protein
MQTEVNWVLSNKCVGTKPPQFPMENSNISWSSLLQILHLACGKRIFDFRVFWERNCGENWCELVGLRRYLTAFAYGQAEMHVCSRSSFLRQRDTAMQMLTRWLLLVSGVAEFRAGTSQLCRLRDHRISLVGLSGEHFLCPRGHGMSCGGPWKLLTQ